jgi:hypothetical protein
MVRHAWVGCALILCFCGTLPAKERVWTDSTGRTMRAEFVREIDGDVTFLKDGKIITLALDKLSARDQQIVRDLAAGKPVAEDPAPAAAPASPMASESVPAGSPPADVRPAESTADKPLTSKPVTIESRTWTDVFGNQVTGKYVRIFGSNVVLLRGGKSVTVKFYELSSEDQEYLRELLTSRGQEGLIPPKVDPSAAGNDVAAGEEDAGSSNVPAGTANRSQQTGGAPPISIPASGSVPPTAGSGGYSGPGPSFPGPSFPGPSGPSFPGPSFPPSGPSYPGPSAPTVPGSGSAYPPTGPGSYPPSSPPGYAPPGYAPPGSGSYPSSIPPGASGSGNSSMDRFNQQMEESRRQQLDSINRMHERMDQQRESLFNRHGTSGECLNCKHNLNDSEMSRSSCPYCGVTWDYEIDQFGNKRQINNSSSLTNPFSGTRPAGGGAPAVDPVTARRIGLVFGVFIGLAVVAGMIIGTIYIIMSIASASSSSQQRHYR